MKLTIKTLAQKSFHIEAEPTDKISEVKKRIEESQGFEVSQQKLIYSGKILEDSKTVEECKIEEKGFLVVMTGKPKAAAPSTPAPAAAPAAPSAPIASTAPTVPSTPATPTPASAASDTTTTAVPVEGGSFDASTLATGSAYGSAVQNLVEMGFERDQVVRAMRAAFNNPDRAAEYLMTGIPEHVTRDLAPQPPAPSAGAAPAVPAPAAADPLASQPATTAATTGGTGQQGGQFINLFEAAAQATQQGPGGAAAAGAGGLNLGDAQNQLAFLRNSPQFQQLRQLVQTQPQLIQPLLQQLAQSNPQMMQLIAQNQDQFFQLLGEAGEGGAEGGPGPQYISVTPEEEAAINRLVALGFDRALAIEAFFACDKNEELAANYLFDHGQGDDWQ
ncbi:UV excision repair protein Rad23 [Spizellomyces punctatus DAOM BR117]|uniref:UV excision repair protein RAD23 n=1 Tax=Spizellomyces punctatus (strain DAOM BR117) TaxID=645134 RepID=A0A0L0H7B1_SPIPD|nr:UV excision repair protein Rad23 [Spizellomyces punctatus DAOM BR117]KNC97430.1 UV excision repair protein Rad23 [Spizellomyces punctatus DAOM BR117]|eukprot:XP_016605470.1 UV excision repair protein Rad23 [Spizellomyces punctatus DAOM BR117]